MRRKFTYQEVIDYVREHYGFTVHTCAIAFMLREMGYQVDSRTDCPKHTPTDKERSAIPEAIEVTLAGISILVSPLQL